MKKILLLVLLLFSINVSAKDIETNYTGITTTKVHSNKQTTSKLNYIYVDGKISYCIEPGIILGENHYVETDNFGTVGISENTKKFFELIVYYGYEYKGHEKLEYYMATQQILWEQLGCSFVTFRKDGVLIDVSKERKEIYDLVYSHDVFPSFVVPDIENKTYEVFVNDDLEILDKNNKIKDYISDNENIKIENNKILFNSSEISNNEITFTNKVKAGTSLVYYNPSNQNVATFTLSNGNEKTFKININVKNRTSDLTINKVDNKTKKKLEGATFELYVGDKLLDTKTTDKDGKLVFEDIIYGDYILKETKAPKGYLILDDDVNISLDEDSENLTIENTKYEMPITSDIDKIYYKASSILLIFGLVINYAVKKVL